MLVVPAPQIAAVLFVEVTLRLFVEVVPRVGTCRLGSTEASIVNRKVQKSFLQISAGFKKKFYYKYYFKADLSLAIL